MSAAIHAILLQLMLLLHYKYVLLLEFRLQCQFRLVPSLIFPAEYGREPARLSPIFYREDEPGAKSTQLSKSGAQLS